MIRRLTIISVMALAALVWASPAWPAEGDLDVSFSGDGKTTTPVGAGSALEAARDIAAQPDGKLIVGGSAVGVGTGRDFALARFDADGELDPSFGTGGRVLTDMGSQRLEEDLAAVALQSDGKMVAVGSTGQSNVPPNQVDMAVARYNPNGTLDTSFSGDGKFTLDLGGTEEFARALAVQSDGKIVVAGLVVGQSFFDRDFALIRLNPNGTLDTTFDADGIVTTDIIDSIDTLSSVAVQPNGRIVAAGTADDVASGSDDDFALARYNANGSSDTTFDADGVVTTDLGSGSSDDEAHDLALQSDGKMVVAGRAGTNVAVARFNANGSLDTNTDADPAVHLDTDGKVTTDFGGDESATGLVVAGNGKITAAGTTGVNDTEDFALARYQANGSLDSTFSVDGKKTTDFGDTGDNASAMALQADGKAVVAGSSGPVFTSGGRFAIARYRADNGGLDSTFSFDGKVVSVASAGGEDAAEAVALQPDGKTVVAGRSPGVGDNSTDTSVVRYNKGGSLDVSFGGDGKVLTELEVDSVGEAVAVQPDGKILVAATVRSLISRFGLMRYNPDGSLDTFFSGDGIQTTGYGDNGAQAEAIALQPDGRMVVAGTIFPGGDEDFALARYNPDGSLDSTFDGDGKVTTPIGPGGDQARAMTLQGNKIVVAGFAQESADFGADEDFAVARYDPNGSLDETFSGDGRVTTPVGAPDRPEDVRAVLAQPGGKIVVGGEADATGNFDSGFTLVRYNTNGSLDNTFSGDGMRIDPALDGTVMGLAPQQSGKFVAAGSGGGPGSDFILARYGSGGSLDNTFSGDGKATTDFGSTDNANAVVVGPDFRITVAGSARNGDFNDDFAMTRYTGDATAPTVTSVAPAEDATGVARTANVKAFFSEEMTSTSVNTSTVRLFKAGTTVALGATVSYDATTVSATLNPNANLESGTKYKAVVTTETRDLAGNHLDQDPSASGRQQKAWFFTVRN